MDIVRFPGSDESCNSYLILGEEDVLVDAGRPDIAEIKEKAGGLDRFVLTHSHPDHIKKMDEIIEVFNPEFYVFAYSRANKLDDGDTIQMGDKDFKVLYTPGHATDHIVLLGDKEIFSGDIVVYNDSVFTGGSFGRTDLEGCDREKLIESIDKLLRNIGDIEELYAGHGRIFKGNVRSIIEKALERAEMREPKYP